MTWLFNSAISYIVNFALLYFIIVSAKLICRKSPENIRIPLCLLSTLIFIAAMYIYNSLWLSGTIVE